ncbi:hypothetical protein QUF70_04690 [Desulfobacterales bacterium HSG17]|nr:hypothetical protein [Desulfobacterales bacterium HSG17]
MSITITSQELDENLEPVTSLKNRTPKESVVGNDTWSITRIYTSSVAGFCEEIEAQNMTGYPNWLQKNKCHHVVSYMIGYKPMMGSLDSTFYYTAWSVFRDEVNSLIKLFDLESWRFAKGVVESQGEDVTIVELDGFNYPLWSIYLALPRATTYGEVIDNADKLEDYTLRLMDLILSKI